MPACPQKRNLSSLAGTCERGPVVFLVLYAFLNSCRAGRRGARAWPSKNSCGGAAPADCTSPLQQARNVFQRAFCTVASQQMTLHKTGLYIPGNRTSERHGNSLPPSKILLPFSTGHPVKRAATNGSRMSLSPLQQFCANLPDGRKPSGTL
jgi:hypothetical protein